MPRSPNRPFRLPKPHKPYRPLWWVVGKVVVGTSVSQAESVRDFAEDFSEGAFRGNFDLAGTSRKTVNLRRCLVLSVSIGLPKAD